MDPLDTINIPDILLENQGLRTASRTVDATVVDEAKRLVEAHRNVEAGLLNFLTNLIKTQRYNPEEIENLLNRVKGIANPSNLAQPDLAKYTEQMTDFLQHLNQKTGKPFFYKPFQKGMQPQWEQIENLATRAEAGDASAYQSLQLALGNAGISAESALGKYWNAVKWLTPADKNMLSAKMPGAWKIGDGGVDVPITFKDFFEGSGRMMHGGASSPSVAIGSIIIKDPDAVKGALTQLSENVSASARLRGVAQSFATAGIVATSLPSVAGAAGTIWGLTQGLKNHPSVSDYDKASQVTTQGGPLNVDPSLSQTAPSNGLGGTTNGNVGGLGGQFSPKPNTGWAPTAPNLAPNPNDWLPSNTSDYYNLVKKSYIENNQIKMAQATSAPQVDVDDVDDVDDVVRNVFTILEQGQPGEATLQHALDYLKHIDAKANLFIEQYQKTQQPATPQNQMGSQVEIDPNVKGK